MKNQFTISAAYQWNLKDSHKALKKICQIIQNRFNGKEEKKLKFNINYRRLRASAGRTMLDSIKKRIQDSQVIIFDITELSPNVFLELGIALTIAEHREYLSIYLIKKQTSEALPLGIPTDLHGYFITEYTLDNKGEIIFKDNNSLRYSIESDVKEYFNQLGTFSTINELENE
jgi:hypothetical protein